MTTEADGGFHQQMAVGRYHQRCRRPPQLRQAAFAPYRSGECWDWRKIKTMAWREANRERWRLFETPG